MNNIPPLVESATNIDRIIEEICSIRTEFIKGLIVSDGLERYLEERFDVMALSPVKAEFLRRDLKHLSESKLDLVHYSMLIRKVKETANFRDLLTIQDFIGSEIRTVILKYIA